jgi:hypothetical protein
LISITWIGALKSTEFNHKTIIKTKLKEGGIMKGFYSIAVYGTLLVFCFVGFGICADLIQIQDTKPITKSTVNKSNSHSDIEKQIITKLETVSALSEIPGNNEFGVALRESRSLIKLTSPEESDPVFLAKAGEAWDNFNRIKEAMDALGKAKEEADYKLTEARINVAGESTLLDIETDYLYLKRDLLIKMQEYQEKGRQKLEELYDLINPAIK